MAESFSIRRLAAMVVFALSCVGILIFLWISFGGPVPLRAEGYRFKVAFPEAATLVEEADVRLAGVNIGRVKSKELDAGAVRTIAEIEVDEKYAPIPSDTRAILRQKTLLGETYVELTPGDPESGDLADGGTLAGTNVAETVELDEIYRIFDPATRRAFSEWVREGAAATSGDFGPNFNDALGNFGPFAESGADLLAVLDDHEVALRRVVRDTGTVFGAITKERGQLRDLIVNAERTFGALASRDDALAETFAILPTFQTETRATLSRLERFARDTQPLVNQLKQPARDLGPTVRDLGELAPDLENLFDDLEPLIDASETGLPAASRFIDGAEPVFESLHRFLPELNPILSYLSFNRQVVAQFLTVGGAALAGNAAGGYTRERTERTPEHYLPQIALVDGRSFRRFEDRPPFDRGNAYIQPNTYMRAIPLGTIESFDCRASGGEVEDPQPGGPLAADAAPPCFVAPKSLYQNQRFPRLRRGRAPRVAPPEGREGNVPADPQRR